MFCAPEACDGSYEELAVGGVSVDMLLNGIKVQGTLLTMGFSFKVRLPLPPC